MEVLPVSSPWRVWTLFRMYASNTYFPRSPTVPFFLLDERLCIYEKVCSTLFYLITFIRFNFIIFFPTQNLPKTSSFLSNQIKNWPAAIISSLSKNHGAFLSKQKTRFLVWFMTRPLCGTKSRSLPCSTRSGHFTLCMKHRLTDIPQMDIKDSIILPF